MKNASLCFCNLVCFCMRVILYKFVFELTIIVSIPVTKQMSPLAVASLVQSPFWV